MSRHPSSSFLRGTLIGALFTLTQTSKSAPLPPGRLLDPLTHHLGDNVVKNWPEASPEPAGFTLHIPFEAEGNSRPMLLGLTQRDVDNPWTLTLNGKSLGELKKGKERKEYYYPIPAGTLKTGQNRLTITSRSKDDITVGTPKLYDISLREWLDLQRVEVSVSDVSTGAPLPARITVTDNRGNKVEFYEAERPDTAVRTGVLYTLGTVQTLEIPPGEYQIAATHGTEWSLDRKTLKVGPGLPQQSVHLTLRQEFKTPGFVAADTHLHTVTFSGHGDASVEERMVTLAGEGVELAIATDHNHQTDYRPYQKQLELSDRFTSVTGNEVTTKNGHFNSFPLPPGKDIPPYEVEDWVKLVTGIRAKGAQVVILNHPRWPDIARGPFGRFGLNRASGQRASGSAFTFNAMELINSGTLQPDPLYLCRDWFALLNHGEKITAVGSSDSHTVGNIVGQGRTYVRSSSQQPGEIDIQEACDAFLRGDTTISLGIFADLKVNDRAVMGELLNISHSDIQLGLRVAASSWITPRRALVFLNGKEVASADVPIQPGKTTDTTLRFQLRKPDQDAWLVCVVLGDAVKDPAWATEEPYTFAATNPVYLDADGDGQYLSPVATADKLLATSTQDPLALALRQVEPIAIQMLGLLWERTPEESRSALVQSLQEKAKQLTYLQEFLRYLPGRQ